VVTVLVPVAVAAVVTVLVPVTVAAASRIGHHLDRLDRLNRVVALDDQLAALRLAARLAPDDHAQAGTGEQDGGERVAREREVAALPAEFDAADVQRAGTDVAEGDGLLRALAVGRAEVRRAGEWPDTATTRGPAGSVLSIVIVPE